MVHISLPPSLLLLSPPFSFIGLLFVLRYREDGNTRVGSAGRFALKRRHRKWLKE